MKRIFFLVASMSLLFVLASCKKKAVTKTALSIVFTCDTQGRLEPCGCFSGQYGGLSRIFTKAATFKEGTVLRFDAGDAMPGKEDYNIILYRYVQQAFKAMNYDAMNLGVREASLSLDQLKGIDLSQGPPLVSANVMDKASGKPLFAPIIHFERNGFKIAVTGVVDPQLFGEALGQGLEVNDMESSISPLLKEMQDADIRVLLAFCDETKMKKLADKFFEFDVILGGKVTQPSPKLIRQNRSVILYTTNQAKNIGYLQGDFDKLKGLTDVTYDIPLLFEKVAEDTGILELAKQYRHEIRQTKLAIDSFADDSTLIPGIEPQAVYSGTQVCASCHQQAHDSWSKTQHAHAFQTLKGKESDANPKCIGCHTVGFGEPSGYLRKMKDTQMVNVGCESCHGPGSEHVRQRTSGEKVLLTYRPLGEGDCKKCHYGEFSRPFKWDSMWPKIKHGKEKSK